MISPETLRRYPYFAGIGDESLRQVAMIVEEKRVPADSVLFRQGDPARWLCIILSGEVKLQYLLGSGELRTVDTLVPGELMGWSAMVEPYKYTAVGTTTKPSELAMIDSGKLRQLCDRDPLLGYRLLMEVAKLLGDRLEGARIQLAAVG
jgi:CRP-like cAMP-binding protein